jgi:hypothetical protein
MSGRGWVVAVQNALKEWSYLDSAGEPFAKCLGEAHVFATKKLAEKQADRWTCSRIEPRYMDGAS